MPELPEVQTLVDDLKRAGLIGAVITSARVFWPRTVSELSPKKFCQKIKGQRITNIWRRGKFIMFDFSSADRLLIHLRMTGRFNLVSPEVKQSKHEHVVLNLTGNRQLRFHDTRKFGRLYLVKDAEAILGSLGPEPLDPSFSAKMLSQRLHPRKRLLKPLLLDQSFIAGLGNIYVDEALWEAEIHPCRLASSLSQPEITALHRAIKTVLKRGLKNLGTTLGTGKSNFYSVASRTGRNQDQLMVFRRADLPCPRCKTTIRRQIVGQRSTHICPQCQIVP